MTHSQHPISDERWSAYLDGQLSPEEASQLEERLATDEKARHAVDELKQLRESLRGLPRPTLGRSFTDRVMQQLQQAPSELAKASDMSGLAKVSDPPGDAAGSAVSRRSTGDQATGDTISSLDSPGWRRRILWSALAISAAIMILLRLPAPDRRPTVSQLPSTTQDARDERSLPQIAAKSSEAAEDYKLAPAHPAPVPAPVFAENGPRASAPDLALREPTDAVKENPDFVMPDPERRFVHPQANESGDDVEGRRGEDRADHHFADHFGGGLGGAQGTPGQGDVASERNRFDVEPPTPSAVRPLAEAAGQLGDEKLLEEGSDTRTSGEVKDKSAAAASEADSPATDSPASLAGGASNHATPAEAVEEATELNALAIQQKVDEDGSAGGNSSVYQGLSDKEKAQNGRGASPEPSQSADAVAPNWALGVNLSATATPGSSDAENPEDVVVLEAEVSPDRLPKLYFNLMNHGQWNDANSNVEFRARSQARDETKDQPAEQPELAGAGRDAAVADEAVKTDALAETEAVAGENAVDNEGAVRDAANNFHRSISPETLRFGKPTDDRKGYLPVPPSAYQLEAASVEETVKAVTAEQQPKEVWFVVDLPPEDVEQEVRQQGRVLNNSMATPVPPVVQQNVTQALVENNVSLRNNYFHFQPTPLPASEASSDDQRAEDVKLPARGADASEVADVGKSAKQLDRSAENNAVPDPVEAPSSPAATDKATNAAADELQRLNRAYQEREAATLQQNGLLNSGTSANNRRSTNRRVVLWLRVIPDLPPLASPAP